MGLVRDVDLNLSAPSFASIEFVSAPVRNLMLVKCACCPLRIRDTTLPDCLER